MVLEAQKPFPEEPVLVRSKEIIRLFKGEVVNSTIITPISPSILTRPFRHFLLHLDIDSTSTPTTLRVEIQFASTVTGKWHTYKQGPFASLYWEDVDTATAIQECFEGSCAGRLFRIKLTGAGVTSSAYFTVSASVEFLN